MDAIRNIPVTQRSDRRPLILIGALFIVGYVALAVQCDCYTVRNHGDVDDAECMSDPSNGKCYQTYYYNTAQQPVNAVFWYSDPNTGVKDWLGSVSGYKKKKTWHCAGSTACGSYIGWGPVQLTTFDEVACPQGNCTT